MQDLTLILQVRFGIMESFPIVAIQGGLGNQLFQWVYAHEILESKEFALYAKFPDGPATNIVRELELNLMIPYCPHLHDIQVRGLSYVRSVLIPNFFDRLWNFQFLSRILHRLGYFREDPRVDKNVHQIQPKKVRYANGYFQKWQYAENQRETIKRELIPVLHGKYEELLGRFDLTQPYVALHVRRGDYRTDQDPKTMIGSLADEYFIEWVKTHPSARIVLLTENRGDVEELIAEIQPYLVLDRESTNAWETLAVMSFSSILLGSNSSLSWWGAWTAHMNGATTYLPKDWDVMGRFNPSDFLFPGCHSRPPIWEIFGSTN